MRPNPRPQAKSGFRRQSALERTFRHLLAQAERTIPESVIDKRPLPIRVVFAPAAETERIGETSACCITLYRRAFSSTSMFLYAALHEIGHVVFSLLEDEARTEFLGVAGGSLARWRSLVTLAANGADPLLAAAAVLEIRRLHEQFAEGYAEYWTKSSYLEARAPKLFHFMKKLFWTTRHLTLESFAQPAADGERRNTRPLLRLEVGGDGP